MAIEIKIHPLDFETDVAIGLDLPLVAEVGSGFKQNYTTLDQAVANAKNLLLTNKGERIMQPEFGCNLRAIIFENITPNLTSTIETTIRESFEYWLSYVFINSLSVEGLIDKNKITISMVISLQGNQFDTRSIQLEILTNTTV